MKLLTMFDFPTPSQLASKSAEGASSSKRKATTSAPPSKKRARRQKNELYLK
ncbi:hypothetical protein Scep_007041 [Stephania cephalantha]|uniref:Uncharacterized protein n=1 Tax=Stephania cephalantha TaxID=152367 RepID=A0AAP0PMU3_9MAGN